MADKSGSGITGSHVLVLAGVLLLGAAVYSMLYKPAVERQAAEAVQDEGVAPVATQDAAAPAPSAAQESVVQAPEPSEEQAPVVADNAQAEQPEDVATAPTEDAPADIVQQKPPSFDLVRVDPEGGAVIAGKAAGGVAVRIMDGDEVLAETVADKSGKFVALFDLPASKEPRSISIEADGADGAALASTGTVLIAATASPEVAEVPQAPAMVAEATEAQTVAPPVETSETQQLVLANPPAAPTLSAESDGVQIVTVAPKITLLDQNATPSTDGTVTAAVVAADVPKEEQQVAVATPDVQPASTQTELASTALAPVAPEVPQEPASPAVVLADETGVRVLQPAPQPIVPSDDLLSTVSNLVIDTITYNTSGDVALGGRGAPQSFARIYVNDRAIQTVQIEADGSWAAPLPDIDAGVYRLRIDEVDADGTVTSRVETPFKREAPEIAALVAQRPNAVVVESGFTLWAIAEDSFGSGFEYVRVYEANRDLIRDPDLIYPGQVFRIPEALQSDDG